MNISKDQIIQLLETQGNHDKAQQASQQLPDQVDTDNPQHAELLSNLGVDKDSLGGQLGGLGKRSDPGRPRTAGTAPSARGAAAGKMRSFPAACV